MQAYALKAAREGKQETSWLNPNEAYEAGLKTFIERILDRSASAEFLDSLETLAQRVALLGALNSLGQITLKATMPGVPDFYQGTEFWICRLSTPITGGRSILRNASPCWRRSRIPIGKASRNIGRTATSNSPWTRHPPEIAHRTCRNVRAWRLSTAGG